MNKIDKYLNEKTDIVYDRIKELENSSKKFISDMKMMRTKYKFGEIPGIIQPFIDHHIKELEKIKGQIK